jgi:hypothetical protein
MALVAAPPAGQKPSDTRQTLKGELRGIQLRLATGRLPKEFNK